MKAYKLCRPYGGCIIGANSVLIGGLFKEDGPGFYEGSVFVAKVSTKGLGV